MEFTMQVGPCVSLVNVIIFGIKERYIFLFYEKYIAFLLNVRLEIYNSIMNI